MRISSWAINRYFILTLAISIVISFCIMFSRFNQLFLRETLLGLTLVLLNGFAGSWINRKAVYTYASKNLFWGAGMNALRLLVLLIVILLCYSASLQNFTPFLITTFTGYFCFLAHEVLDLHFSTVNKV